jgi:cytidylate kinase
MYSKKGRNAADLAEEFIQRWSTDHEPAEIPDTAQPTMPPSICLGREIGAGALEIADSLHTVTKFTVVDREIMEHIAQDAHMNRKTVAWFDERYPGTMAELFSMAFSEKSFVKSDYVKHLFRTVVAIANRESTIFVGRGVHRMLARDRVLAVKIAASPDFRARRLSELLEMPLKEAEKKIHAVDHEQKDFFKKTFGHEAGSFNGYDLVLNRDYCPDRDWAVSLISQAFKLKFGEEAGY